MFIVFFVGVVWMLLWCFIVYIFFGLLIWCWGLVWIGLKFGEYWNMLGVYFYCFDVLIGVLIVVGFVFYVWWYMW